MSIEAEGIENHINRYFRQRNLPYTYDNVIYWKNLRIGGQPISMQKQMNELGLNAKQTLYNWYKAIDANQT